MVKLNSYQKALLNPYLVAAMVFYVAVIMPGVAIVGITHPVFAWFLLPLPTVAWFLFLAYQLRQQQKPIPKEILVYFFLYWLQLVSFLVAWGFSSTFMAHPVLFAFPLGAWIVRSYVGNTGLKRLRKEKTSGL